MASSTGLIPKQCSDIVFGRLSFKNGVASVVDDHPSSELSSSSSSSPSSLVDLSVKEDGVRRAEDLPVSTPFLDNLLTVETAPVMNGYYSGQPSSVSSQLQNGMSSNTLFSDRLCPWDDDSSLGKIVKVQRCGGDGTSVQVLRQLPKSLSEEGVENYTLTYYSTTPAAASTTVPAQYSNFSSYGSCGAAGFPVDYPFLNQYSNPPATGFPSSEMSSLNSYQSSPYNPLDQFNALNRDARGLALSGQMSSCVPSGSGANSIGAIMTSGSSSCSSSSSFINGLRSVGDSDAASMFNKNLEFSDVMKYVLQQAKTDSGSKKLMYLMANGNQANIDLVFAAVMTDVYRVMEDEYGLRTVRRLLDFCNMAQKELLVSKLVSDHVMSCARNPCRANSLTQLIRRFQSSGLKQLLASILARVMEPLLLSRCRLVQQCYIDLNEEECQPLYEALRNCVCSLAKHTFGCSSLYTLILNTKGYYSRLCVFNAIADDAVQLASHISGNHILKRILSFKIAPVTSKICYLLLGHFKELSTNRHGSHVVEGCLKKLGISYVFDEFLNLSSSEELVDIACHPYGNYVMKKALKKSEKKNLMYYQKLVEALFTGLDRLKEDPFGKSVYAVLTHEKECKNGRGREPSRKYWNNSSMRASRNF